MPKMKTKNYNKKLNGKKLNHVALRGLRPTHD